MHEKVPLTAIIATFGREEVLLQTIDAVLNLQPTVDELLVVDQTPVHAQTVENTLRRWQSEGKINWIRLSKPSIPGAMNLGLLRAKNDMVLFLDDDLIPDANLAAVHWDAQQCEEPCLVAGRVLQPWHSRGEDFSSWHKWRFASTEKRRIDEFMGGNFSLSRSKALTLGGFDENFLWAAYNFEKEFAERWRLAGYRIRFEPKALIHHLKAPQGGTRTFGSHLTTITPAHSVGTYYYILQSQEAGIKDIFKRAVTAIATRHHLKRPWWIPVSLIAELSGFMAAVLLKMRGARYINVSKAVGGNNKS